MLELDLGALDRIELSNNKRGKGDRACANCCCCYCIITSRGGVDADIFDKAFDKLEVLSLF